MVKGANIAEPVARAMMSADGRYLDCYLRCHPCAIWFNRPVSRRATGLDKDKLMTLRGKYLE